MREKFKKIWATNSEEIKKEKIRTLFNRYLIAIAVLEIVVFVLFWIFQIEETSPHIVVSENIPFHWKAYFLTAFLIPVAVTFVLGFLSELRQMYSSIEEKKAERIKRLIWPYGFPGKRKTMLWLIAASGFLVFLLIIGFCDADTLSDSKMMPFGIFAVVFACMAGMLFLAGVSWLVMKYKTRISAIDNEYRKAMSRHFRAIGIDSGQF